MSPTRRWSTLLPGALVLGLGIGCVDEKITTPPPAPLGPPVLATVVLTTITTGGEPDANGYLFLLDGVNYAQLDPSAVRELSIMPGSHVLGLADIASNCLLTGENPRTFNVGAGERLAVTYQLDCPRPSIVTISTLTQGTSFDPDGYLLTLDGAVVRQLAILEQATLTNVRPGLHTFRLSSVAGNCNVAGGSSRSVIVSEGQDLEVHFTVDCGPRTDDTPGEKLVISSRGGSGGSGDSNLEIMNPDGSGRQRLTDNPGEEFVPEFSPDGSRILFLQSVPGSVFRSLVLLERNARQESALSTTNVDRAVWSPDGSQIAFSRFGRIFVMRADGTAETPLTSGPLDNSPYWSPDGSRIAFTRGTTTYVVRTNGTELRQVGGDNLLAGPWSPDGRYLLATVMQCISYYYYYSCYYAPTPADLVMLEVATGNYRHLTNSTWQTEWSPVWSRDGASVYFISAPSGNPDVYRIDVASGAATNLTASLDREEWVTLGVVGAPGASRGVARVRRP